MMRTPFLLVALACLQPLMACKRGRVYTDEDDSAAMSIEPRAFDFVPLPEAGGHLVKLGWYAETRYVRDLNLRPGPGEEIFVSVVAGGVGQGFGWAPGTVARVLGDGLMTTSPRDSRYLVAVVRSGDRSDGACEPRDDGPQAVVSQPPLRELQEGRLRVRVFHGAHNGACFGSMSHLDADAELDVPVHEHERSVEALYIESGDGTLILGDERRPISPGDVVYIPAGTPHGYEHGSQPLRAWQVYAPPGPEQRFMADPEAR